ncbi:Polyhydroxyalkanoate depolymerase, intracellular [Limimaricola hongkongensis DSM 17492]|uniref:Polyhydroxyalkanoate depolymerase, intracellular n=1 Tax=Limimaricola hongkongensis DSM 17492 TaxID=1122180 RepID=A0A017HBN8_9RHOB|nr:Polyhydroxyalkanoate depolymerase, intracellular [Limimaricola hongkongensis DSM 17492]
MPTYDLMESMRNTNQWLGATARAMGDHPAMAMTANPAMQLLKAWGEVTERSFERMVAKPDWGIPTVTGPDGKDHVVRVETLLERPFGDLIHFTTPGRKSPKRRVLLVAPMSGHYATLLRKTVISLLPDCDVHITDWHNARDIPVSKGKFDVEDYTKYVAEFMRHLGPDLHVIAVCQPVPLTLAATAMLAEDDPTAQPRSLTLIGGPVDPDAAATDVTDFGRRVTMGQLEHSMIQRVGFKYKGVGRQVYPGLLQLGSFITMNASTHAQAFTDQIFRAAHGKASEHDKHNQFYDEYLAVMDMSAEFYLSTVERVFKSRDIARNAFSVDGRRLDLGKITSVAVKIVEGEKDDISAPGQCLAALDLLTGLSSDKKAAHLEPGAGHYGIFAGSSWRNNIRPLVLEFIDANSDAPTAHTAKVTAKESAPAAKRKAASAPKAGTKPRAAAKPAPAKTEAKAPEAKAKEAAAPKTPDTTKAQATAPQAKAPEPVAAKPAAPKSEPEAPQAVPAQAKATEAKAQEAAPTKPAAPKSEPKAPETAPVQAEAAETNAPGAAPERPAASKPTLVASNTPAPAQSSAPAADQPASAGQPKADTPKSDTPKPEANAAAPTQTGQQSRSDKG